MNCPRDQSQLGNLLYFLAKPYIFVKELNASRIISHIQIKDVGMAVSVCVQLGNRITVTQE
jgi:hypothetical protein